MKVTEDGKVASVDLSPTVSPSRHSIYISLLLVFSPIPPPVRQAAGDVSPRGKEEKQEVLKAIKAPLLGGSN